MEQNLPIISKKLWRLMRVMFFMLKKGISKAKIIADLNMMIKRGKITGKPTSPCSEYEFSCRKTPRHPLALFSYHKKHKNDLQHLATSNPPLAIDYSDDIVINAAVLKALDILKSPSMTSPPLLEFGSPLDEKMMITDSPSLITKGVEYDRVDEAAEEFIRRFYNDRRREN
ncbi:hypothetical protein CTI12_AA073250 [Artemisia annua]|uniref:Uncharacterized protein n=1 Tax=Artemisia annua TaxID=35608 RepID=A0A2U1Q503_ARTAN|nr:hypothetical protein CTI12_AA073250 [Artemisia annua]